MLYIGYIIGIVFNYFDPLRQLIKELFSFARGVANLHGCTGQAIIPGFTNLLILCIMYRTHK